MARYADPEADGRRNTQYAGSDPDAAAIPHVPQWREPAPRRRRSGASRFFTALFALLLLVAVPVVSAYVAYKLASGENPFDWPPTMDLSKVF
jgi:hypothetical protein